MNWKIPLVALGVIAASAALIPQDRGVPSSRVEAPQLPVASEASLSSHLARMQEAAHQASTPPWATTLLNAQALSVSQQLDQLARMPDGDSAIALSRKLEAGVNAENVGGYLHALMTTSHSSVERVAIAALARAADARTMVELAGYYAALAPEHRGRILSVLEAAENPEAATGLAAIVAADTNEKRSPLMMSALYGIANTGSVDNVQYLLEQMATENAEYAVMALERVRSPQGIEMIRAAAQGSKDLAPVAADYQPALRLIAEANPQQ